MAWFWSGSSHLDRPEIEVLADGDERMSQLFGQVKHEVQRRDPDYKYVTNIWMNAGFRFPDVERPFQVKVKRKSGNLPEQFGVAIGAAVSRRFIEVLESLEPGVHNYLPLELMLRDATLSAGEYGLLNICKRLDTISIEHSEHIVRTWPDKERFPDLEFYAGGSLMMKKGPAAYADKIAGHHLWYEYKASTTMMSDQLAEALMKIGAIAYCEDGLDYIYPVKEV